MNTELDNNSKLYYDTVRFTTSSEYYYSNHRQ